MARTNGGHMALYEAVNHEKFKAAQDKELERTVQHSDAAAPAVQRAESSRSTAWPTRPRAFQIHDGRIEAFIPYHVAITIVIAAMFTLVVTFAVGSWSGRRSAAASIEAQKQQQSEKIMAQTAEVAKKMAQISTAPVVTPVLESPPPQPAAAAGSDRYVIVIKELTDSRNLEPAKKFFDEHGIPTEIKSAGSSYQLVTRNRFESVRKGSEGAAMLEKIKNVGARYKSPAGYGSFAPKMFSDAYGKKI